MKLNSTFFRRDVLQVAPNLLGKTLCRRFNDGRIDKFIITETEAYRGEEDLACHARKGRTKRTEVMYADGGLIYVYLIYGIYWLLNIVTGSKNEPQAVLIRAVKDCVGPGKVGKLLELDNTFYGENMAASKRIWIVESTEIESYTCKSRVGIDYAPEIWKLKPWRYVIRN